MASFYDELKRRNVFRVGAAYAAAAWLIAQIADTVLPAFALPGDTLRVLFVILGIGFPVTLVLAWIYDITPEGIQRTDDAPDSARSISGRGLDFVIIGCLTVAVLLLTLDRFYWNPSQDAKVASVAVLPFDSKQLGADMAYLGDGLTDSLIMRLSRLPQLRVKSRSLLGDEQVSPQLIGESLGVDAVCIGRISRRGDILDIAVEVVRVIDGSVIWTNVLRRNLSTLLELEGEVSAQIAAALQLELTGEQAERLTANPTDNPEAHRLYMEGRHFWNQRTEPGLRASASLYRQAVDLDPGYALAWSGLADSYLMLYAWGIEPPTDVVALSEAAARRAIELDPTLAEPWATIGYYNTLSSWDWDGAREAFNRSIELNPGYSTAHHWYAFFLSTVGEADAAVEEILKARESEPLSPIIGAEVALFLTYDGRSGEAIDELGVVQMWNPEFTPLNTMLLRAYALSGQVELGRDVWARRPTSDEDSAVSNAFSAMAWPKLGLLEETQAIYDKLIETSHDEYVMPAALGVVAAALGDNDAAFAHFEEGLSERSIVLSWLRDPLISNIRNDPRYNELLARAGLEPQQ